MGGCGSSYCSILHCIHLRDQIDTVTDIYVKQDVVVRVAVLQMSGIQRSQNMKLVKTGVLDEQLNLKLVKIMLVFDKAISLDIPHLKFYIAS